MEQLEPRNSPSALVFLDFDGYADTPHDTWGSFCPLLCVDTTTPAFDRPQMIPGIISDLNELFAPLNLEFTDQLQRGFEVGIDQWVVVGGNGDWAKPLVGVEGTLVGLAHVGTFGDIGDVAWIFPDTLATEELIALTIAHEVSHTLGLEHVDQSHSNSGDHSITNGLIAPSERYWWETGELDQIVQQNPEVEYDLGPMEPLCGVSWQNGEAIVSCRVEAISIE